MGLPTGQKVEIVGSDGIATPIEFAIANEVRTLGMDVSVGSGIEPASASFQAVAAAPIQPAADMTFDA